MLTVSDTRETHPGSVPQEGPTCGGREGRGLAVTASQWRFLMQACKRGNSDIVRLVIERGADCNILSKHRNSAMHFAKQSDNVLVYDLLKSHLDT